MAAQGRQVHDGTYTESRVYGVSEDIILSELPAVIANAIGKEVDNPLPGCFTAQFEGMPGRELIVRVEPEAEGTRVRLDVRLWQDQRKVGITILAAVLVFPIFIYLLWTAIRSLVGPTPKSNHPPEVLAHGIFRGLSKALSSGGSNYRVAAQTEAHLGRPGDESEEEQEELAQEKKTG